MSLTKRTWWVVGLGLFLAACGGGDDDDDGPAGVVLSSGATCPSNSKVTYDNFARAFLQTHCTSCHAGERRGADRQGAPDDVDLDSLAAARDVDRERVDRVAAAGKKVNAAMPPGGGPAVDERRQLGEWLACGLR